MLAGKGTYRLLVGDCREMLRTLPEKSVHCCISSPPYFALRDYGVDGQIGLEPTPEDFIDALVQVYREVWRVLRDDGVCWINLGDSYADDSKWGGSTGGKHVKELHGQPIGRQRTITGLKSGDLINMPHRVAAALQADGWYWRSTIVWHKRCLSGGTWLYARTTKGDAPAMLKDLVRLDPKTVQLWDGSKWTQVVGWSKTPTNHGDRKRGYLELVLRSGERIGCTAEHRWPTTNGEKTAAELQVGDELLSAVLPPPNDPKPMCLSDEQFGWLCGFYLAEGCKTEKGVNFAMHSNETAEFEKIRAVAELLGGTASFQKRKGNGAVAVVYSTALRQLLGEFISGTSCYNKRLDRKAWMRPNGFLNSLLQGYLDGDGHRRTSTDEWRIGFCKNDGLAVDLRAACARLGYSIRLTRVQHTCNGKKFPGWRGSVRMNGGRRGSDTKIVAIEQSRARTFWDIEVADEPNWFCLASGVISHNSPMPESVSGWRWVRCRVKVAKGQVPRMGDPSKTGHRAYMAGGGNTPAEERGLAQWQPCPGCEKCRDTGGYVLRRGRWRPTNAHEYIFLMAKGERYFCDSDAVQEVGGPQGNRKAFRGGGAYTNGGSFNNHAVKANLVGGNDGQQTTRNPRNVWTLSSEPFKGSHFATFPSEIPRRAILASTSAGGCCAACGAQYAPVVDSERVPTRPGSESKVYGAMNPESPYMDHMAIGNRDPQRHVAVSKISGYRPTCNCNAGVARCVVLDHFAGSGTTGQVAVHLGRDFIGCELNPQYAAMAERRIETPWVPHDERKKRKVAKTKKSKLKEQYGYLFQ